MSQQYDNNMRGVLFKNDRKEQDSHPDYKGSCEINGVEHWISAWIKEGRQGKFMSLSFKVKEEAPSSRQAPRQQPQRQARPPQGFDDMPDDLPPF
jgi:hypothetical protein